MNLIDTLTKVKFYKVIACVAILIWIVPPIINGGDELYRVHDLMDSLGLFSLSFDSSHFFDLNPNTYVDSVLTGVPRSYLLSPFSLNNLVIYLFGPLYGLIVNNILIVSIGAFGMYKLLGTYLLPSPKDEMIVWYVAVLFIALPFFELFGLGIFGAPLLIYAYINLYNGDRSLLNLFYIVLFCSYAFFYHVGVFFLGFASLYFIYDVIKNKKVNTGFVIALATTILAYGIVEYLTIYSIFFSSDDFASHRIARSCDKTMLNYKGVITVAF